jgi:hypothetical protein
MDQFYVQHILDNNNQIITLREWLAVKSQTCNIHLLKIDTINHKKTFTGIKIRRLHFIHIFILNLCLFCFPEMRCHYLI